MFFKLLLLLLLLLLFILMKFGTSEKLGFTYNGFGRAEMSLDGIAKITPNGLLMLTNYTKQRTGHAFYPNPLHFKNQQKANETLSFSTTFVFGIISEYQDLGGHGITFVISPSRGLPGALASSYLGLFNEFNNGNSTNHVVAVELDTIINPEFGDINDNHVGIDINGLRSVKSAPASYFANDNGAYRNLSLILISGEPIQVWVDYNGVDTQLNVTLAPINVPKPDTPLLSLIIDLSPFISDPMYVGFSSSTGSILTSHYLLGWSFKMDGRAQELIFSQLPNLPQRPPKKTKSLLLSTGVPIIVLVFVLLTIFGTFFMVRRKRKFAEVLEDWELDYGPHRFKYKDLYIATRGFKDKELLGSGGFGRVYRGVLPTTKIEVAVKRIAHESRQGMKEFVAEIVSMGRLRHRNLVQLMGYCRRKGELLLVYDFMPNGSLDKVLFGQPKSALSWSQRFRIIKGVASGLFYLHEGWEQIVIHRDVKASNVLLDREMNARLGDFGLARLYDHGTDPQTTHVVGTLGYLAPEFSRTGRATRSTDVFAFGAFMLEVACGRRPIESQASADDIVLVDWVLSCWNRGTILWSIDPNLGTNYVEEEMELVLKLGLLCSQSVQAARPSMRQVVQILEGDVPLQEFSLAGLTFVHGEGFGNVTFMPHLSSISNACTQSSSVADSILSQGR